MTKQIILSVQLVLLLTSCSVWKQTAKRELTDGFYTQRDDTGRIKVYVNVAEENIHIYQTSVNRSVLQVDTSNYKVYSPSQNVFAGNVSLTRKSFDLDFLTIPLKFRYSQKSVPSQLNTNINGAVYVGFRTDRYTLNYQTNPLFITKRRIMHFGYSLGLFTGMGNTQMSPTNTNNILSQEYDGIVWSKGIAGIVGINKFTLGFAVGFDNLLNKDRNIWIYEGKPWLGLAFGLNLN